MYKDQILNELAANNNVAQFVSFDNSLRPRYSRILGSSHNLYYNSVFEAIEKLLLNSGEKSVNIRSYAPDDFKSKEFVYGVKNVDEAVNHVKRLAKIGLHTIVNETIDVNDGGVSGVVLGKYVEFSPGDTPRCVEKPGCAGMYVSKASALFKTVYSINMPESFYDYSKRTEFSIHPLRRGFKNEHVIIWEIEHLDSDYDGNTKESKWPNNFSRLIGDKAYGLLMAESVGLQVPKTTVVSRKVAPFKFGYSTETAEYWLRTCPVEQVPGKYTTQRGWTDPYILMYDEDKYCRHIASVLCQEGVDAQYSGACITGVDGKAYVEGKTGYGDDFMLGIDKSELPQNIIDTILTEHKYMVSQMGPVRFEWAYDGNYVWVLQFHLGATESTDTVIYPGEPEKWTQYQVSEGLEKLRAMLDRIDKSKEGIELVGNVGISSHFGDVLRKAKVSSKILNVKPPV